MKALLLALLALLALLGCGAGPAHSPMNLGLLPAASAELRVQPPRFHFMTKLWNNGSSTKLMTSDGSELQAHIVASLKAGGRTATSVKGQLFDEELEMSAGTADGYYVVPMQLFYYNDVGQSTGIYSTLIVMVVKDGEEEQVGRWRAFELPAMDRVLAELAKGNYVTAGDATRERLYSTLALHRKAALDGAPAKGFDAAVQQFLKAERP